MAAWGRPEGVDVKDAPGASTVAVHIIMRYAQEHGYKKVDFLGSRPSISDGSFRFKRKWGAIATSVASPYSDFKIRVLRLSPATAGFLVHNPLVVRESEKLVGKALLSGKQATRRDVELCFNFCVTDGLEALAVYCMHGMDADAASYAQQNERLILIDLSETQTPEARFCERVTSG